MRNKNQKSMFSLLLKIYTTAFLLVGIVALLAVTSCAAEEADTNEPDLTESNQSNLDYISNQSNDAWTTSNEAWLEKSNQSNTEWTTSNDAWTTSNEAWLEKSNQSNTEWTTSNDAWNTSNTEWTTSNEAWLVQSNQSNTEYQSNLAWLEESNQSNTEWTTSNEAWLVQSNADWLVQSNEEWLVQSNVDWIASITAADVSKEHCEHADLSLNCFISVWDTFKGTQVKLPLVQFGGDYDFYVDWGDGSTAEHITSYSASHTYTEFKEYTVHIAGKISGWSFDMVDDSAKGITDITQWGSFSFGNSPGRHFYKAENLVVTATDAPDLSQTTDLSSAFEGAIEFNGLVNHWNVSTITDMSRMFVSAEKFNQPVGGWNVSNVTTMKNMFNGAGLFNQDTTDWTLTSLTTADGFSFNSGLDPSNIHPSLLQ